MYCTDCSNPISMCTCSAFGGNSNPRPVAPQKYAVDLVKAVERRYESGLVTPELVELMPLICQLIDGCKARLSPSGEWTEWDQDVRERLAKWNLEHLQP